MALAAGLTGALATATPTGTRAVDVALRVGVAIAYVLAGSSARPPALLAATTLLALGAGGPLGTAAALVAFSAAVLAVSRNRAGALLAPLAGLAAAVAALRLGDDGPHGLTAVVAALALAALTASAARHWSTAARRRVGAAGAVGLGLAGAAALSVVAAGAMASNDVASGMAAARAGLAAARNGELEDASRALDEAATAFGRANHRVASWWAKGGLAVPVVAQNLRALDRVTEAGATLADTGAAAARDNDPGAVGLRRARVDLAAVDALAATLEMTASALTDAHRELAASRSPWLLPPVGGGLDDLTGRIGRAQADAALAIDVAELAPALLGEHSPRRWFLAFQTPAELRGSGGIIGNFGELVTEDGSLDLVRVGRDDELNRASAATDPTLVATPDYAARYGRFTPQRVWQNVSLSPDFPSVATVIEDLYPRTGGPPVDGVISLDPYAMAAVLELTGPVTVPQWPEPIGAENAADVLLRQQYLRLGDDGFGHTERVDFLEAVTRATFDRLESVDIPGPARLAEVLGPVVREGRLKLHSARPDEQALLVRLGAADAFPPVRGDAVGLITQNASGNKIDLFLERSLRYDATWDPATGEVRATTTITLVNRAPAEGLPPIVLHGSGPRPTAPGHNRLFLSLFTPLGLEGASLGGAPLLLESQRELGRNVYSAFITVPPDASLTVSIDLAGQIDVAARTYHLDVASQPTVNPDHVEVDLRVATGWQAADDLQHCWDATGDRRLTFRAVPAER